MADGGAPVTLVSLRPETPLDEAFAVHVFASTRAAELAALPEPVRVSLVRIQYLAQARAHAAAHPAAERSIILVGGAPAGRMIVDRAGADIRLVDIALLPPYRSVGHGGALIRALLEEAGAAGRRVTLHVLRESPAARLYTRLGFVRTAATEVHEAMEWRRG